MVNKKFEAFKVRNEIKKSGSVCTFYKPEVNEFGEPTGNSNVGSLLCLYHEENSYVKLSMGDTTQIQSKKLPKLLCLFDDINSLNVSAGYTVLVNGKEFNVTGLVNVQEWNIIVDISLEVQHGF